MNTRQRLEAAHIEAEEFHGVAAPDEVTILAGIWSHLDAIRLELKLAREDREYRKPEFLPDTKITVE